MGSTPSSSTTSDSSNGTQRGGSEMFARVVQGAHDTVDRLAETAAPHVQRLAQGVDSASETLSARADQVRQTGDEWADSLRTTVRENPLAAIAAALAVGVVIARLTS
jgi:ElaB/YqjD/DUF883 family membrane-anchored ribosome-binding protein